MRARFWITVLAMSALAAYGGWWMARDHGKAAACAQRSEMAWLRSEFGLDDATVARIGEVQRRFACDCQQRCEVIRQARAAQSAQPSPEAQARLEAELRRCEESRREHVKAIAACMPPDKAKAYVDLVMPKVDALSRGCSPGATGCGAAR